MISRELKKVYLGHLELLSSQGHDPHGTIDKDGSGEYVCRRCNHFFKMVVPEYIPMLPYWQWAKTYQEWNNENVGVPSCISLQIKEIII